MSKRLALCFALAAVPIIAIATSTKNERKQPNPKVNAKTNSHMKDSDETDSHVANSLTKDTAADPADEVEDATQVALKKTNALFAPTALMAKFTSRSANALDSLKPTNSGEEADEAEAAGFADNTYARDIGKLWLVLVGVNDYSKSREDGGSVQFGDLNCAVNDVVGLTEAFRNVEIPEAQIVSLYDDASEDRLPTKANVVRSLRELASNEEVSAEDTFMFVFSGHGINIANASHICLSDTAVRKNGSGDQINVDTEGTIKVSNLLKFIVDINAGTKILLSDACRNNNVDGIENDKVGAYNLSAVINSMANSEDSGQNQVMVVSSCLPGQISVEQAVAKRESPDDATEDTTDDDDTVAVEERPHGLFLGHLIEGLDGRAGFQFQGNHDDVLTMHELFQYASWQTIQEAQTRSIRQDPFLESATSLVSQLFKIPDAIQEKWRDAPVMITDELTFDQKRARKVLYPAAMDNLPYDRKQTIETVTEAIKLDGDHSSHYRLRRVANLMEKNFIDAIRDSRVLKDPLTLRIRLPENGIVGLHPKNSTTEYKEMLRSGSTLRVTGWSAPDQNTGKKVGHYLRVTGFKADKDKEFEDFDGWVVASQLNVDRVAAAATFHEREQRVIHAPESFVKTYSRSNANTNYNWYPQQQAVRPVTVGQFPRIERAAHVMQNVETRVNRANQVLSRIPYAPSIPSPRSYLRSLLPF